MRGNDRYRISLRHVRGRMVESILVILATAVGVALVAAMAAFIQAYNGQTDSLLSHPAYRELLVEVVGNETELTQPAVAYDATTANEIRLGIADVDSALESVPSLDYGYLADQEQFTTRLPGEGGFAGRFGGGRTGGMGAGLEVSGPNGGAVISGTGTPPEEGESQEGFARVFGTPDGGDGQAPAADAPGEPGSASGDRFGQLFGRSPGGDSGADDEAQRDQRLEEFFATDPDVVTDLPVDSFPGRRVTSSYFSAYGLDAAEGSLFANEDVEQGNQVMVLGDALATILFPDGGAVGTRARLNFQTYTIIGILEPTALLDVDTGARYDRMAFVPNGEAQVSFGGNTVRFRRPTRTLRFAVADSGNLVMASAQLQIYFDTTYGDGVVRITAPLDELSMERRKLSRILGVILFLSAAGLFIASINLFNLMLMRVIRRTKGIGITRALGATRREVFRQFLNESALMSAVGAIAGLAISPVVFTLLRSSLIADVGTVGTLSAPYLILGAAGAFGFSVLFGVYPARQAARIDAAIAIRTE